MIPDPCSDSCNDRLGVLSWPVRVGSLIPVPSAPLHPGFMLTLFHHPFCPHSRFVRLVLAEHGLEHRAGRGAGLGAARGVPDAQSGRPPRRCWSTKASRRCRAPPSSPNISTRRAARAMRRAAADAGRRRPARRSPAAGELVQRQVLRRGQRAAGDRSASTSATCASSRAAGRPTPTRSVRRASISAIISPISAGWCARATGWPATG